MRSSAQQSTAVAGSSSAASTTPRRSWARRRTRGTWRSGSPGEGWDVRVVTTYPYYPEWRRRPGDPRLAYRRERAGGVTVLRCPSWIPGRPTGARRLAHYASFAASSLPASLAHAAWRPDFALVVAPTLASAPGALLAAPPVAAPQLAARPGLRGGRRPPARAAAAGGAVRRSSGPRARLLRSFDVVTSITEPMLDVARESGRPRRALVLLPNWANLALVRPLDRPSRFRADARHPATSAGRAVHRQPRPQTRCEH